MVFLSEKSAILSRNKRERSALDAAESSWKGWIHILFWTWLNPLLKVGYTRQIEDNDIFEVSSKDECSYLTNKIESVRDNKKHLNIWFIIIKAFWQEIILSGLYFLPSSAVRLVQPMLLKQLVFQVKNPNSELYTGVLYACALGIAIMLQAFIQQQLYFHSMRFGQQIRIGLSCSMYKRLLYFQPRQLKSTTIGQLINLISNDVYKFGEFSSYFHYLWNTPLEALIVFGIMWYEIGVAVLFGYGVLLLLTPLQLLFSRRFGVHRKSKIKWTDRRLKIINDALMGCEIVKMYQWEKALESLVNDTRHQEFKCIQEAACLRSINYGISFASLPLISLATFGGCWLLGEELSPGTIFTVLTLFSIIRAQLTLFLPTAVERLSESIIATRRMDEFFSLSQQTTTENVSYTTENNSLGTITMHNASFKWASSETKELIDINLNLNAGSLVAIVGVIGAGKSTLLAAILNEMILVNGSSLISGRVAYVSQIPWILNDTIRENILFGKQFDRKRYEIVLESCCLNIDLNSFNCGDLTMIGDKGVNLSGGQKSRIALARALYSDSDIYLFDDPLAAVDRVVAQTIFKRCISNDGLLSHKTRILVTHHLHFLPCVNYCILLDHGKIQKQGSLRDLLAIDDFEKIYTHQLSQFQEITVNSNHLNGNSSIDNSTGTTQSTDPTNIIKKETLANGTVNSTVWLKLLTSSYGWTGLIFLICLLILTQGVYDFTNKWLSIWSSKSKTEQKKSYFLFTYVALCISALILAVFRANYFFRLMLNGASRMHNAMFKGVLYSPLNFYESNPVGRIINRFSKDQDTIDEILPITFFDTIQAVTITIGTMLIISISCPWVLLIFLLVIPIFLWVRRYYLRTSQQLKRLESVTRSPVLALLSSSFNGLMTIRAFHAENHFFNIFIDRMNANTRASFVFVSCIRWLGLRLDLCTCLLTFSIAILSVIFRNSIDPAYVGLSLMYCINLMSLFQWGVRQSAETENHMVSAERIYEYCQLPPESNFSNGELVKPENWPSQGRIQFNNYEFKYRSELQPALRNFNMTIDSSAKIGVIGRTGAGKSSMFQGLFRLRDKSMTQGQILIDDIDIHTISLTDLRSNINIIPQSPILFSDTLRYNLDPLKQFTDEQLWNILDVVQLKSTIQQLNDGLYTQVAESTLNFSVGECQLICLARALLRQTKIVLIDEATAHVDTKTEKIIQNILREKFSQQTVLTIAHRLNTIMESEKIVVLDHGTIVRYDTPENVFSDPNLLPKSFMNEPCSHDN